MASSTMCAGRHSHPALTIDVRPGVREDLQGLVVFDEHPRLREHLERRQVDLAQLVVGEHLEPEAAALARARARIPSHDAPPAPSSASIFLTPSLASSA